MALSAPRTLAQGFCAALANNAIVKAGWRVFETSLVVTVMISLVTFLGTLAPALRSVSDLRAYDWHTALGALVLGVLSGLVNGLITFVNLVIQYVNGTNAPTNPPSS